MFMFATLTKHVYNQTNCRILKKWFCLIIIYLYFGNLIKYCKVISRTMSCKVTGLVNKYPKIKSYISICKKDKAQKNIPNPYPEQIF